MLLNLCIKNYALIDNISIDFGPGLNILTGETGAGKSIIIDAINLIIGERAYTEFIRTGRQNASVEAAFEYEDEGVDEVLKEYGIEPEDNTLIITREINIQGRSISRLNGKMVPASALKRVGKLIIDIHGQHEHQSLLDSKNHIRILDSLGYEDVSKSKKEVKNLYKEYCQIQNKISQLQKRHMDFHREQDRLRYELNELEKAQLKADEDTALREDREILENAEKIFSALDFAYSILYHGLENLSVTDCLSKVIDCLEKIVIFYAPVDNITESLKNILYELEDISSNLRNLRDSIDFDMGRLDEINRRLELLDRLKSKYNKSIAELLDYKAQIAAELDLAFNINEEIEELKTKLAKIESELSKSAIKLHEQRQSIAQQLEDSISKELKDLGMKNVVFKVEIRIQKDPNGIDLGDEVVSITEDGIDEVEFLISTNPGEPLKPLAKIISGGESSRIMLALKSILAKVDKISCLIFDEIDAGIGGRTAQAVGEKLSKLARQHQILCVTHSPQIASIGDFHYLIKKESVDEHTSTRVYRIEGQDRINELARMLGGAKITKNTLAHAQEMLNMAKKIKESI
ncbi:MAG: DNA repair protein RecN [Tepidanaerobacteraceae bacterium]|jgi:DNA repair protein RecN (Recombination protein N)|nr:DNA repair protein RecN [Tepidanaerobacter sp.]